MTWFQNVPMGLVTTLVCFLLFWNSGFTEERHREKRVAVLGTTEIPAESIDLSQFNFTDLVNGMLRNVFKGANSFFSFLSVTSHSTFAFHKVSILIYNISNIKYVDYKKFPMRYCYCLTNRTNDLADYTALLLDIIGNSTSSLKELFKSTSIVSVSQSNESDCIYFCVMTGRTGRNLSDIWDVTQKAPVVNVTYPRNESIILDMESILPNFITSPEDMEIIMDVPKELWTINDFQLQESDGTEQYLSPTINPMLISSKQQDLSQKTSLIISQEITKKEQEVQPSDLHPWTSGPPLKGQSSILTKFPSWQHGFDLKGEDAVPTKAHDSVDIFLPKGQHQSSDTIPLFPLNDLKEHSISFSSQKAQEGYPLQLPGWTSPVPLEMLDRPFTMIPLWTELSSERASVSRVDFSNIQEDTMSETSSLIENNKSLRVPSSPPLMAATVVKTTTTLLHGTSSVLMPTISNNVALGKEEGSTKMFSWPPSTTRRNHEIPSAIQSSSIPVLSETLLPQVQSVSVDGHKTSLSTHVQSRCLQARLAVNSPSVTLAFHKLNPCVMELCKFYQQCLCFSQEQNMREDFHRNCVQSYSWYMKNAIYICEKVKRKAHLRTLKQKCLAKICNSI